MKLLHFIRLFYSAKVVRNLLKFNILLNEGNPGPQGGTLALPDQRRLLSIFIFRFVGGHCYYKAAPAVFHGEKK